MPLIAGVLFRKGFMETPVGRVLGGGAVAKGKPPLKGCFSGGFVANGRKGYFETV
jgi:hypothetical protein